MLHQTATMTDIDIDHWRNLQSLLVASAKARTRIVVIHEHGRVRSVVHSSGAAVSDAPTAIGSPATAAEALHTANPDVEFVAVFERDAVDDHFAAMGASWDPDEDLDAWVRRLYNGLDDAGDGTGIVTHPGPASRQLGLQWRIGGSFADLHAAVERHVPAGSSVAFAVLDQGAVWATLVVGFDATHKITLVTTADPSAPLSGTPDEVLDALVELARARHGQHCALAVAIERADADPLLEHVTTERLHAAALAVRRDGG